MPQAGCGVGVEQAVAHAARQRETTGNTVGGEEGDVRDARVRVGEDHRVGRRHAGGGEGVQLARE